MPAYNPAQESVLLEGLFGRRGTEFYSEPLYIIRADTIAEVKDALAAIDVATRQGRSAAGFLAYELGYALEPRLEPLMPQGREVPLLALGVFEAAKPPPVRSQSRALVPTHLDPSIGMEAYRAGVERILDYIRAGDVYQVNYTYALGFEAPPDADQLYTALKSNQPVPYPALVRLQDIAALSLSPELFFRVEGGRITARPMKGTASRERFLEDDKAAALALQNDEKNRAENLMIVDLMRNDLSRISKIGTVRVPALFSVETYRTLHTLTSTIEADLREGVRPSDIVKALFPCGSVTGAPKIRAMEIIRELEAKPRGVYTGAIGVFRPDGSACFNVAIRTLTITNSAASVGVGGGIVADSNPLDEAAETRLKAQFLSKLPQGATDQEPLKLIETLRWNKSGGFELLAEHLDRLQKSAAYFDFERDPKAILSALHAEANGFAADMRIRLVLSADGSTTITSAPLDPPAETWRYAVSDLRIASADPYRAHKTTRRALLDDERTRLARVTGCDEVLFLNERGEVAEGSITSVFVKRGGVLVTPPLSSGCLPGTLRRSLLEAGKAIEGVLWPDDLSSAEAVFLGNSVRGLIRASAVGTASRPAG